MPLNIRNPEANRLADELAALTGQSKTNAVIQALRERLERTRSLQQGSLNDRLSVIAKRCSHLPILDDRSAEAILGYDKSGLPR